MIQVHLFSELNQLHSDYRVPPLDVNLGLVDMELKCSTLPRFVEVKQVPLCNWV